MLLYLHIPFCDSKCFYCSFNSYTELDKYKKDYMKAIIKQTIFELEKFDAKQDSIESVFIGGGTPSCVEALLYEEFFHTIKPYLKKDIEITTEANPNSATKEWLKNMKDFGVNRISFGVQSFDEKKLRYLGRNHTKKDAINSIMTAKQIGFENISLDLIYDTYLDSKELLKEDLKTAFSLPINHISAYSLTIEKATKFYKNQTKPKDDETLSFWFVQKLKEKLPQYEISNFGTYESFHNKGYWMLKDYIGIGSGAVGFLKNIRYYPTTNVQNYIKNPLNQRVETLKKEELTTEKIFLGLRSCVGVSKELLPKEKVKILLDEDKIYEDSTTIYNKNFFLSDELALFLIED